MSISLYQIPDLYRNWQAALEENDGELTPDMEELLQSIEDSAHNKAEAMCRVIRNSEIEGGICRAEAVRWTDKARTAEARVARLKKLLLTILKVLGVDALSAGHFKVRRQRANQPTIRWLGPDEEIPEWAQRVKVELDGRKALEAYRAGHALENFSVETTEFLVIR